MTCEGIGILTDSRFTVRTEGGGLESGEDSAQTALFWEAVRVLCHPARVATAHERHQSKSTASPDFIAYFVT